MKLLRGLAVLLLTLTLGALMLGVSIARDLGDPLASLGFRVPIAISVLVYFAACWCVTRPGTHIPLGLVLGVAVILRLALISGPPLLSSDIYRYVWDGRVQDAGINPYRYIPADPALAALRDTAIYPHINRSDYAPTIYPPAAQAIFAAVSAISDSVIAMKIAMVGFEALAIACLMVILRRLHRPVSQVLIYAWNPVALWEFAGSGHVDAAAIGFIALAFLLRAQPTRSGLTGIMLGAAILVKFLPAVIGPALFRADRGGWRLVAATVATIALFYGFYVWFDGAGSKVFGFLGGYGGEEGLTDGSGIWLLAGLGWLTNLPSWLPKAYLCALASLLAGLGVWIAFRGRPQSGTDADIIRVCQDATLLGVVLMVGMSPHYAWYFAWLAVAAAIVPSRAAIWLSGASILLYYSPFPDHFLWQSLLFAPAFVLAGMDVQALRLPGRTTIAPLPPIAQGSF
jgi:hypothetical protein